MLKLASLSSLLAVSLVCSTSLTAQGRSLPGLPVVSPPGGAPGLIGQPLFGNENKPAPSGAPAKQPNKRALPDPATIGIKKEGAELKKAVAKVKALPWHKKLKDAKSKAAESGKPILLLQTLGDIGGYA
jgi:hypothetical protein